MMVDPRVFFQAQGRAIQFAIVLSIAQSHLLLSSSFFSLLFSVVYIIWKLLSELIIFPVTFEL